MKTVVLGATPNPDRYAYKAVHLLKQKGHEVVPVGIRKGEIEGIAIEQGTPEIADVHTVTLYVNPDVQRDYYDYILRLKPKRIIFNPGTENPDFYQKIREAQLPIDLEEACTLVLLRTGGY